jgi:hypothetical protein
MPVTPQEVQDFLPQAKATLATLTGNDEAQKRAIEDLTVKFQALQERAHNPQMTAPIGGNFQRFLGGKGEVCLKSGMQKVQFAGQTVEVDGKMFKEYYGSASDFNKGEYKHVEGKRILEAIKGPLRNTLVEMEQDLQSAISYAGGKKLMDIRKVNYVTLGGDNAGEHLLM